MINMKALKRFRDYMSPRKKIEQKIKIASENLDKKLIVIDDNVNNLKLLYERGLKDSSEEKIKTLDVHKQINEINLKIKSDYEYSKEIKYIFDLLKEKKNKKRTNDNFILFNYRGHIPRFGGYTNLGDYIQTIAVKNVLIKLGINNFEYFDRDSLSFYSNEGSEETFCMMQGWFSHTYNFLPINEVTPIWIGTHFDQNTEVLMNKVLTVKPNFFQADVGCRDLSTLKFCQTNNVPAYFSRCCTLLYDYNHNINAKDIYLVNIPDDIENLLPKYLTKDAVRINQRKVFVGNEFWTDVMSRAEDLLTDYANNAKLVITTALHCAAPCIAMGVPVILVMQEPIENSRRFSALTGLLNPVTVDDIRNNNVNYDCEPVNIASLKEAMLHNIRLTIERTRGNVINLKELNDTRDCIRRFNITKS